MGHFKQNPAAQELMKLKRKLHNLRFILFVRFFVDTREEKKIAQLNKAETCNQYVLMKEIFLEEKTRFFIVRWFKKARFLIWKLNVNNSTKKFDEQLWH